MKEKDNIKQFLHRKYGFFKCHFSIFDVHEKKILTCMWCEKKYKAEGLPFVNMKLTPFTNQ